MDNQYIPAIKEYIKHLKPKDLIKQAFREIRICKSNIISSCIIVIIGIVLSLGILEKDNSLDIFEEIIEFIFETNLSIFGCILAVYSIVLAFLSDDVIKKISKVKIKDKDAKVMLSKYTFYYDFILTLLFISLCITGLFILTLNCYGNFLILFFSEYCAYIISSIIISIYFIFSIRVFYELKSMIYNTVSLFRFSIAYRLADFDDENDKKRFDS